MISRRSNFFRRPSHYSSNKSIFGFEEFQSGQGDRHLTLLRSLPSIPAHGHRSLSAFTGWLWRFTVLYHVPCVRQRIELRRNNHYLMSFIDSILVPLRQLPKPTFRFFELLVDLHLGRNSCSTYKNSEEETTRSSIHISGLAKTLSV